MGGRKKMKERRREGREQAKEGGRKKERGKKKIYKTIRNLNTSYIQLYIKELILTVNGFTVMLKIILIFYRYIEYVYR